MKKNLALVSEETEQMLQDLKSVVAPGATDSELKLYSMYCTNTGLNPFMGQVHFIKRAGKPTFQVSIDGYRAKAEQTNKYAGSEDYLFDEGITQYEHIKSKRGFPITATAIVNKIVKGQIFPIKATVAWTAYCPAEGQNFMWKKMPYQMLGKCAEAAALRKAFPNVLGGLYIQEELDNSKEILIKEEVKEVKEIVKPKEETIVGTEEIDIYADFERKIKECKTSEEALSLGKEIKQVLDGGLLSLEEVAKLKLLFNFNAKTDQPSDNNGETDQPVS